MDPELSLLLEQLFFGRTMEITQPLQVTTLGTDFGASVVGVQNAGESNLAASALDLARQTSVRNSPTLSGATTNNIGNIPSGISNSVIGRMTGGGY